MYSRPPTSSKTRDTTPNQCSQVKKQTMGPCELGITSFTPFLPLLPSQLLFLLQAINARENQLPKANILRKIRNAKSSHTSSFSRLRMSASRLLCINFIPKTAEESTFGFSISSRLPNEVAKTYYATAELKRPPIVK